MKYRGTPDHDHQAIPGIGVLLVNVGSPEEATTSALRRYLRQFLSDPRVIEDQGLKWKLVLNGIILRTRPAKSAAAYREIWTDAGSPLVHITRSQAVGLQERLRARVGEPVEVAWGMGYGRPSVAEALRELQGKHCPRLLVLPMYPQYAAATVGSAFDAVASELRTWRWVPEVRFVSGYHDHPGYIRALAESIRTFRRERGPSDRLLISFHGLPVRSLIQGDPYHCQCLATARRLWDALEVAEPDRHLAFQSRFGREEWLKPYAEDTLREWARTGIRRVDVVCPGFSADCLETLEEIGDEYRGYFTESGGEDLRYIPALNASPAHLDALADLACQKLQGWATARSEWDADAARANAEATRERAEQEKSQGINSSG